MTGTYWQDQKNNARKLPPAELAHYAAWSQDGTHRCQDCFMCACVEVQEEREAAAEGRANHGAGPF